MFNVLYTDGIWLLFGFFYENKQENIKVETRKLEWRIIRKTDNQLNFRSVFTVLERVIER